MEKNRFSAEERANFLLLAEETINDGESFPENYLRSLFQNTMMGSSDDQQYFDQTVETIRYEIENSSMQQWIEKILQNSIKQTLPSFVPTGDFNDAPFSSTAKLTSNPSLATFFGCHFWTFYYIEEPTEEKRNGSLQKQLKARRSPSTEKNSTDAHSDAHSDAHFGAQRDAQSDTHSDAHSDAQSNADKIRMPFNSNQESPVTKSSCQSRQHDYVIEKSSISSSFDTTARNARCKPMIELLQKGFEKFQHLCDNYQPRKKEPVRQDIVPMFTPSPFDNTNIQYRKALDTRPDVRLPLKFLWNGVSEIDERKSKRNDASVLFFFESALVPENQQ